MTVYSTEFVPVVHAFCSSESADLMEAALQLFLKIWQRKHEITRVVQVRYCVVCGHIIVQVNSDFGAGILAAIKRCLPDARHMGDFAHAQRRFEAQFTGNALRKIDEALRHSRCAYFITCKQCCNEMFLPSKSAFRVKLWPGFSL